MINKLLCQFGVVVALCALALNETWAATRYVVKDNPGAEDPFTSWEIAAPDIQTAVNVALAGELVLVADAEYDTGETVSDDGITNRVVIGDSIAVCSTNGPGGVSILGGNGIRCVTLGAGAVLNGFTLANGLNAGGIRCEDASAIVTNCVIRDNSAAMGGGVRNGTVLNCRLVGNTADLGGGAHGCVLRHCELTGNSADHGAGAHSCEIWNSILATNTANECGGGVYDSTLYNCLLAGNAADLGGGAGAGALYNCTVAGNRADTAGGGVYSGLLFNAIVYFNTLTAGSTNNWDAASMSYSCAAPMPAGAGNLEQEPLFVDRAAGNYRLQALSPCIQTGTNQSWMSGAQDLDGLPRISGSNVDMGAYAFIMPNPMLEVLGSNYAGIANGEAPSATSGARFMGGQGQSVSHTFYLTNAGNREVAFVSWQWEGTGTNAFSVYGFPAVLAAGASTPFSIVFESAQPQVYEARLSIVHNASNNASPFQLNVSGECFPPVARYVVEGNPAAAAPYTNWATAAADIQSAVDYAMHGDTVWVSNGTYNSGRVILGGMTNRVGITKPVHVRSVNGPMVTIIAGENQVRCVYLGEGAALSGFVLSGGLNAGGIWCANSDCLVSNCMVLGNSAEFGGGAMGGTLRNCSFSDNDATDGGGIFDAIAYDCLVALNTAEHGGGAAGSVLYRSIIDDNVADEQGGGVYNCTLYHSTLSGNQATGAQGGGGAYESVLYNCVVVNNHALYGGGARNGTLQSCTLVENTAATAGGGVYGGTLLNCIVQSNQLNGGAADNWDSATLSFSCTQPLPSGVGNIDLDPLFIDATNYNFCLQPGSPCINVGDNENWMTNALDSAGNPRIVRAVVDLGAYEYAGIPVEWLVQYHLPIDGSADHQDPDLDLMDNWQEWLCESNPTNNQSFLGMAAAPSAQPADGTGLVLRWQSATGKVYQVERGTNLLAVPTFVPVLSDVPGQAGYTIQTDHTATADSPYFYRVNLTP